MAAYIDGFNLYYGMKAVFRRKHLWLDVVDLGRVSPDRRVLLGMPPGNSRASARFTNVGTFCIDGGMLRAAQLPPVVNGQSKKFARPAKWS